MRYLIMTSLLALAPLSWGEDVYYCVEEESVTLEPTDSGDAYELVRYKLDKFTLKYEAASNRLAIKGASWAGDEPFYIDCDACQANLGRFWAGDPDNAFALKDGRFNYAAAYSFKARMKTGTCTKF